MNRGQAEPARVDPQRLTVFAGAVLAAVGVPERDARLVADSLVTGDLWGHQSHGVLRWYVDRIRAGVMRAGRRLPRRPASLDAHPGARGTTPPGQCEARHRGRDGSAAGL
ncbi:MAG TPA: Ldh family oxidoreductase [Micromonosporaceae bacterium]|jgi:LDH2 family malate/lactate/ureidoglycolate dehydrogenase